MKQTLDAVPGIRSLFDTQLFRLGQTKVTLVTLITMAFVILVTLVVSRLMRAALRRALERRGVESGSGGVGVASRLLHYSIVMVGLVVAFENAGIRLDALLAAGAVFAVGIGLAMQNIAQNFVSGVILLVERTIKPGDVLEVQGVMVRVVEMGIRATLVRSRDEEDMIVPNSTLVQSTVKNYTLRDDLYRIRVTVGVTYDSDLALVRRTLEQVAEALADRAGERDPIVLLADFGSSSVDYQVSVWTHDAWERAPLASALREAIWQAFKQQGIVIAFPQVDVHLDRPVIDALGGLPSHRTAAAN